MEAWDAEVGLPRPQLPHELQEDHVRRLLRLLEIAAARGAFPLQEFQEVGEIYTLVRRALDET